MLNLFKVVISFLFIGVKVIKADYCSTIHAEYSRRQLSEFSSESPYDSTGGAKHIPFLTIEDGFAEVIVGDGNPYHPMTASADPEIVHYVTHIYVLDQDENVVFLDVLDPTQGAPAISNFEVPTGATSLTAYEWCNKHGLWVGPTVEVVSEGTAARDCTIDQPEDTAWESIQADLMRMQSMPPFDAMEPYTEQDGKKHTPYITISEDGMQGSVVVGTEEVYHPMVDGDSPLWITSILITDEKDNIIAMENLNPIGFDKAEMLFDIPEGVEEVTALGYCNLHGLWKGPTVILAQPIAGENVEEEETSSAFKSQFSVLFIAAGLFALL